MAFDDDWDAERETEYFDASLAQGHLLIIRAFDAPKYYRTENNPDGMVHPGRGKDFEPFPNTVVRCAVADLDAQTEDGPQAKIYPESVLFPFSITKIAKSWVGKGPQLVMWRKTGPKQTDPYELRNMRTDEAAVKAGMQFLDAHPEFMELKAPEPYDETPPRRERRDDRGYDDRRDRGYDDRDFNRRYSEDAQRSREPETWGRGNRDMPIRYREEHGARDWGQHDEPPRRQSHRGPYQDDPWARQRPGQGAGGSYNRDGSFLSRSRDGYNHQGDPQRDEDIPF